MIQPFARAKRLSAQLMLRLTTLTQVQKRCVALSSIIVAITFLFWPRNHSTLFTSYSNCSPDAEDFDAKCTLSTNPWPVFQGYSSPLATPLTHPSDPLLLQRIQSSQNNIKHPLISIVKQGRVIERHSWKFEKIIHQTWKTSRVPAKTANWIKKWQELNPDWTYMFWTDQTARDFVKLYFPFLLDMYDGWAEPVQRADMFRYMVLYAMGGVYADIDMEALRPMDEVRNWSSCVLSREPEVQSFVVYEEFNLNNWANNWTFTSNAFMACRSHHPFMFYLLSRTVHNSPLLSTQPCPLWNTLLCTGPALVSQSHAFYLRSVEEQVRASRKEVQVTCYDSKLFIPSFDKKQGRVAEKRCQEETKLKEKQRKICEQYRLSGYSNTVPNFSFTTHHWMDSYHHGDINAHSVDITTLTRPVLWAANRQKDFKITYTGD